MAASLWLIQPPQVAGETLDADELLSMSIEDLMAIEITSVSKRAQKVSQAPAAVTVLTAEDIRRSGVTSIPEALRMVPGLHVARIDGSKWAITARGFPSQFQYANKLLVLIDGRTVYSPSFAGVYWDVQDTMLEDIDRIEVVRGPGGTLWGANAVNGVINIITKRAGDTPGLLIAGGGGSLERGFARARYGGALGEDAHYRFYTKGSKRSHMELAKGDSAHDGWRLLQGGLRLDWDASDSDALTFQGDYYKGKEHERLLDGSPNRQIVSGGNLLARWQHSFSDGSGLQSQFYYDRTERDIEAVVEEERNTVDLELEYRFAPFSGHDVVVGAGYRMSSDEFDVASPLLVFTPTARTDHLVSGFLQDQITLIEDLLVVTIGSKFERNDYTGFEAQPSARILLTPNDRHSLWAAVSRAVHTPARVEHDVSATAPDDLTDTVPPIEFSQFNANRGVDSEDLLAFEVGYRGQPLDPVSLELAAYYFDYDDLRNQELTATVPLVNPSLGCVAFPPFFPISTCTLDIFDFANSADGRAWGLEAGATWAVSRSWRLSAGYSYMRLEIDPDDPGVDPLSELWEGETPRHQIHLRSHMNLPWDLELDANLYWVQALKTQAVGSYERLDLRLGWQPFEQLELSLVGQNLSRRRHQEFKSAFFSLRSEVPRSVYGMATWRY